jgi:DNA primase
MVEGYMDLISAHQVGVRNVIASSGTALTPDQVQLVRRYTKNITIVYDADSAGSKAAMRGVDVVLAQDMDVKVAKLPEGDDPDSFVRKAGSAGLKKLVDESLSFVDFIIATRKEKDASPEERSKTIRILVKTVAQMPDALKRDLYLKHIAGKFALREAVLQEELSAALRSESAAAGSGYRPAAQAPAVAPPPELPPGEDDSAAVPAEERDLFGAVLRGGAEVARFVFGHLSPDELSHPVTRRLSALVSERMEEGESLDPAALVDAADDQALRAFISEVLLTQYEPARPGRQGVPTVEPGDPLRIASDGILRMKQRNLRTLKKQNQESLRQAAAAGGDVVPYLKRNTLLDEELARLEKEGLQK